MENGAGRVTAKCLESMDRAESTPVEWKKALAGLLRSVWKAGDKLKVTLKKRKWFLQGE